MQIEDLYWEVVNQLEERADDKTASRQKLLFHKKSGYKSYGIKVPERRELIKSYKNRFNQLSLNGRFKLARMFYKSGFVEQASFGHALLRLSIDDITPVHFDFLDEIVGYFNNWGTTDGFCVPFLQSVLRKYPKETLRLLRKWNRSENMWKRRASMVAFVRKIGATGDFTDEVLELCDNLIWDEEDLVRKGVGWALKDNMHGDKKRVLDYVKSLRRKGVSSTITLYAIRNLKGKEREEVLNIKPEVR